MALTNVSTRGGSTGQPSAPFRSDSITCDLDNSYPNPGGAVVGGYDISAYFPGAVAQADFPCVPHYDGAALRWFKVVNDAGVAKLKAYVSTNDAPGAEVANGVDLSGHTGLVVGFLYQ